MASPIPLSTGTPELNPARQLLEQCRLELAADPDSARLLSNLSFAALRVGDLALAATSAASAITRDPRNAGAWLNQSAAALVGGDATTALASAEQAAALAPGQADPLVALGAAARELGAVARATEALLAATAIAPQLAEAWCNLALVLSDQAQHAPAMHAIERARALAPARLEFAANQQLLAQYDEGANSAALRELAAGYGTALRHAGVRPLPAPAPRRPGPLRVAYLSPDLRAHPVGFLMRDVLGAHDRDRMRPIVYSTSPRQDWLSAELRSTTAGWHDVMGLDGSELAARLRADDIDVLVDLAGHTAWGRPEVAARRPARRQYVFLGWFAAVGVPDLDGAIMASAQLDAAGQAHLTEPGIALVDLQFRYRPAPYAPPVAPLPSRGGAPFTFGSFNNSAKLNPEVLHCWAAVLAAVPGSRLVLCWKTFGDARYAATLRARLERLGVDPARVELNGATDHAALLARYGAIDVALDPFPFPGGMTTLEALTQGVPVVTLEGPRPVSRQSAMMLRAVGLGRLVARTPREYVAIAAELAAGPETLAALRATLRARVAASVIGQPESLARALESVYAEGMASASRSGA